MGIADLNHCQSMLKRKTREVEQLKDQLAQLKNTGSWVKNFLVTVPASIYVMDKTGSICLACSDLQAKALGYKRIS